MAELLELKGVEKSYPRGQRRLRVLRNVSLSLAPREIVAVIGSRYEGKTTLLKLAAGFELPDAGEVWLGERLLSAAPLRERERVWREEIVWISRDGGDLQYEMLDHVAMPLRMGHRSAAEAERVAMAALERVGVSAVARRRWEELSNWERVLVALARGVARKPRAMIVDDLLDGLGASKTREAGELLSTLAGELGCGVLMSASDSDAALLADRVWCFDGGELTLISDPLARSNVIDFPGSIDIRGRGHGGPL